MRELMIGNLEPEEHVMGDKPVFRVFTQTSEEPYDRHDYKLTTADGRSFIFDNYEDLRAAWFQNSAMLSGSTVQVLDIKKQKKKSKGGFA
jgi:hypothetical protein